MKKLFSILLVIVCCMSLVFSASCSETVEANDTLLNGGFETVGEGKAEGWTYVLGASDSVIKASNATSNSGSYSLKIDNNSSAWSYAYQTVKVEKNSVYKLSGQYKVDKAITQGNNSTFVGAHIAFLDNLNLRWDQKQTADKMWEQNGSTSFVVYVDVEDKEYVSIMLSVGAKNQEAIGEASFDDIKFEKVDDLSTIPTNKKVYSIYDSSIVKTASDYAPWIIIPITLLTVAFVLGAYYVIRKNKDLHEDSRPTLWSKIGPMAIIMAVALIVRVLLALFTTGPNDMGVYQSWLTNMMTNGLTAFYANYSNSGVLPIYVYLVYLFGGLGKLMGLDSLGIYFMFKIPAIICDIVAIYLLYAISRKFVNKTISTLVAALWAFVPAILGATAIWGSMDSILATLLMLSLYFLLDKKFVPLTISFTTAMLTSMSALYLLPILVAFAIYIAINQPEYRKTIILCAVFAFIASMLVYLPLVWSLLRTNPVAMFTQYFSTTFTAKVSYTSYFANLYSIFGLTARTVSTTSAILNYILLALMAAFSIFVYFKNKNRTELLLLSAFAMAGLAVFATGATIGSMLPILALLLIYSIVTMERRVFGVFAIYVVIFSFNLIYLASGTGMFGAQALISVTELSKVLDAGYVIAGVLNIINTIYLTYLVFDITMQNHLKQFKPMRSYTQIPLIGKIFDKSNKVK